MVQICGPRKVPGGHLLFLQILYHVVNCSLVILEVSYPQGVNSWVKHITPVKHTMFFSLSTS